MALEPEGWTEAALRLSADERPCGSCVWLKRASARCRPCRAAVMGPRCRSFMRRSWQIGRSRLLVCSACAPFPSFCTIIVGVGRRRAANKANPGYTITGRTDAARANTKGAFAGRPTCQLAVVNPVICVPDRSEPARAPSSLSPPAAAVSTGAAAAIAMGDNSRPLVSLLAVEPASDAIGAPPPDSHTIVRVPGRLRSDHRFAAPTARRVLWAGAHPGRRLKAP